MPNSAMALALPMLHDYTDALVGLSIEAQSMSAKQCRDQMTVNPTIQTYLSHT